MSTPEKPLNPVAFPQLHDNGWYSHGHEGMLLRDWMAGQALAGLLADSSLTNWSPQMYAEWAHRMADAMLDERAKR